MAALSTGAPREAAFVDRRKQDWEALDALVQRAHQQGPRKLHPDEIARLSPLYRDLCADLARAQAARYSAPLVEYLQGLTAIAHAVLYGKPSRGSLASRLARGARSAPSVLAAFPRAVRRRWRATLLASALFFIPFALGLIAALADPTFAFRIVPQTMLEPLTEAYAKGFADGRPFGDDALMAGFYVNNNVGIALRCFAMGVFGGLGSAFYLVQNGLSIGAILGYVASQGAGGNIFTFIIGHGSFELGAIVLSGGAGLSLGWSIVAPGEKTRLASLQAASLDVIVIVCGAAVMLLLAAAIEAFWSGSAVSSDVKRSVGALFFVLTLAYLLVAGRGYADRGDG